MLFDNLSSTTCIHTFSYFATYVISLPPDRGRDRKFYEALLQMRKRGSGNESDLSKVTQEGPSVTPGPRHHGGPGPLAMGDQDPTHTGTEEVGEVLLQQLQQGLLLDGVIGSRVFVKQVDQG